MAATQAEKQQNDVNSEKVQSDQHLNARIASLQNGTDKNSGRGSGSVAHTKPKNTAAGPGPGPGPGPGKNIEMSQYRQEAGSGGNSASASGSASGGNTTQNNANAQPTTPTSATGPGSQGPPASDSNPNTNSSAPSSAAGSPLDSEPSSQQKPPSPVNSNQQHQPVGTQPLHSESPTANAYSGPPEQPPVSNDSHGYAGFPYGNENASFGSPFGPRQSFGPPKPQQQHHQQRFISQQPSGPTPTLNQLLQSTNTVPHRYPNNYGGHPPPEQHYPAHGQPWPATQKNYGTGPPGSPANYRTQPTVSKTRDVNF
nr:unnamed protein product [Callosobruchus analis]